MGDTPRRLARRRARRLAQLLRREKELWASGVRHVAGVDEAGVGPLAGPVVAAAVIFPPGAGIRGVDDSKRLRAQERESLAEAIRLRAAAYAIVRVEPAEIDRLNIYHATLTAMRRALLSLSTPPEHVLVDGREIPGVDVPQERWIKGDARCHAIAAASILAKTARDRLMIGFDATYPGYGFAVHKGYATLAHRDAIRRLGPSPIHRLSFHLPQPLLWD